MCSISAGVTVVAVAFAIKSLGTYTPGLGFAGLHSDHVTISVIQKWQPNRSVDQEPAFSQVSGNAVVRVAGLATETSPPESMISFADRFASVDGVATWRRRVALTVVKAEPVAFEHSTATETALRVSVPDDKSASPIFGRAAAARVAHAPITTTSVNGDVRAPKSRHASLSSRDNQNRTAIYDISSQVVYLPNGRRLEAHSGFGSYMDDPRYVHIKRKGSTPPNTYRLVLREKPFHGVQALRLIPIGTGNMFDRDGILAHPYFLGPNGQSNGCVSFADYPAFLNAYLNGEIDRLVVVERLEGPPNPMIAAAWFTTAIKGLLKPFERSSGT
jgi:hypothetical protein